MSPFVSGVPEFEQMGHQQKFRFYRFFGALFYVEPDRNVGNKNIGLARRLYLLPFSRVADMQNFDFSWRVAAGYFKSAVEFRYVSSVVGEGVRDADVADIVFLLVGSLYKFVVYEI